MIGTMTVAGDNRDMMRQLGTIASGSATSLWKAEPRLAVAFKPSFDRPRQGVMSEYLWFTCLNLGMAAGMMLAIATAFNWVAKACLVNM